MNNIHTIIFDLDGTLYQDQVFYKEYLSLLVKDTPWEYAYESTLEYIESLLRDKTPQRLGEFYETQIQPISTIRELYEIPTFRNAEDNFESRFYSEAYSFLGDAWSILQLIARAFCIAPERRSQAFLAIREHMISNNTLELDDDLRETIAQMNRQGITLYLFTNTPQEGAIRFVQALGLQDIIPNIEFGINKPYGLRDRLPKIVEKAGCAKHVVSIGDHSFNDLSPAKQIGAKTILVSPYAVYDGITWNERLSTLQQLNQLLRTISY